MPEATLDLVPATKVCTKCKTEKSVGDFYRNKRSPDLRSWHCKVCQNAAMREWVGKNRARWNEGVRARRQTPKGAESYKDTVLMRQFGLSLAEYRSMLAAQGGGCATCGSITPGGRSKGFFCVDHDHGTGRVRGLLCNSCNVALGIIKDSTQTLIRMIEYLEQHKGGR